MKKQFRIVENAKIWTAISLAIIVIGVVFFAIWGFNLGLEFTGGVQVTVMVENVNNDNSDTIKGIIKGALDEAGLTIGTDQKITSDGVVEGFMFGYKTEINGTKIGTDVTELLRIMYTSGGAALTNAQKTTLTEFLGDSFNFDGYKSLQERLTSYGTITLENETISSSVSQQLFKNALLALGASLLGIGIYIIFRFRRLGGLSSALAAVIALVHDVLIMLSFVAIAGVLWNLQIGSTFVAAVVTIVAYSINNTIVIFDRIRENQRLNSSIDNTTLVNRSIAEVLSRTIITSATTILAVLVLAVIGVAAIQEFVQPILVGLIAGTYSSVFLVSPVWCLFRDKLIKPSTKPTAKLATKPTAKTAKK